MGTIKTAQRLKDDASQQAGDRHAAKRKASREVFPEPIPLLLFSDMAQWMRPELSRHEASDLAYEFLRSKSARLAEQWAELVAIDIRILSEVGKKIELPRLLQ